MADEVNPQQLRGAMSHFATGVSVVTTGGSAVHGMTANSLTCVSLVPPLVLICVDNGARMLNLLRQHQHFALSVLADNQRGIARHFADSSRPAGPLEFDGVDCVRSPHDVPLISGALSWLECELEEITEAGDHHIVMGRVTKVTTQPGEPLLFFRGSLGAFSA